MSIPASYLKLTKHELLRKIEALENHIAEVTYERNVLETQEPDAPEVSPSEVLCEYWEGARSFDRLDLCREIAKRLGKRDTQALIADLVSVI